MRNKIIRFISKFLFRQWNIKLAGIHLRTTHYNYARHLESVGNFDEAIGHYELSDTHRIQVPRMLSEDIPQLEAYIVKSKDKLECSAICSEINL